MGQRICRGLLSRKLFRARLLKATLAPVPSGRQAMASPKIEKNRAVGCPRAEVASFALWCNLAQRLATDVAGCRARLHHTANRTMFFGIFGMLWATLLDPSFFQQNRNSSTDRDPPPPNKHKIKPLPRPMLISGSTDVAGGVVGVMVWRQCNARLGGTWWRPVSPQCAPSRHHQCCRSTPHNRWMRMWRSSTERKGLIESCHILSYYCNITETRRAHPAGPNKEKGLIGWLKREKQIMEEQTKVHRSSVQNTSNIVLKSQK